MSNFLSGLNLLNPSVLQHNGGTSTFTLAQSGTTNATQLFYSGVAQVPGVDFNVSGTTLTTTSTAPAGTNNVTTIQYFNTGIVNVPADTSVTSNKISSEALTGQTSATIAAGDTILLSDADASGALKKDTVQGILDLVPAGGSQVLIGTAEASTSASLTITGLSSTYNTYLIIGDGLYGSATESVPWLRLGDSGGVDSGASDYSWVCEDDGMIANTAGTSVTAPIHNKDDADAQMELCGASEEVGNAAGEGFAFTAYLHAAQTGQLYPCIRGQGTWMDHTSGHLHSNEFGGSRRSTITTDRVNFQWNTGTITGGRLTVWGIAHA